MTKITYPFYPLDLHLRTAGSTKMDALRYAEHIRDNTPANQVLERVAQYAFIRYLAEDVIDLLTKQAIEQIEESKSRTGTALGIKFSLGMKYALADFSASAQYREAELKAGAAALRVERLERQLTRQGKVDMTCTAPELEIKIPFRHPNTNIWGDFE